jgi:hypothetical protein
MATTVDIVVARYNEDMSWIPSCIPRDATPYVYNKGAAVPGKSKVLPNVGREGHTYLHHIVQNYDNLADINVFIQGRIDDHVPNPRQAIHDWIEQAAHQGYTAPKYAVQADYAFRHTTYFGKQLAESQTCFGTWFEQHVHAVFPESGKVIPFYKNGLFAVSRYVIQTRPISYYETLLLQLQQHEDPEIGHYLERSWLYVFDILS